VDTLQLFLGAFSGSLVGFMLGVAGGGGSILAVPLMIYLVGVHSTQTAIGTSAVAVAANAAVGLVGHARRRTVDWRCGGLFAACGALGALVGAQVSKAVDGHSLMVLFALLMLVVALFMLRKRHRAVAEPFRLTFRTMPRMIGAGAGTGMVSGFFGIGGGFLIVPSLMQTARLPALNAVATSLLAVMTFGAATAASYALSGFVVWPLAIVFVTGGAAGVVLGTATAGRLAAADRLMKVLAVLIACVGLYTLCRTIV
jgi:uncharacterized protein